jgi:hypothetical protein
MISMKIDIMALTYKWMMLSNSKSYDPPIIDFM